MASIRERAGKRRTTWAVLFRDGGKQRSETFDDLPSAEQFADMVERMGVAAARRVLDAREGIAPTHRTPTVAEQVRHHIDALSGVTAGTVSGYRAIADQIAASTLGPMPIDCVTRPDVSAWIRAQEQSGAASKTIRNRQSLLSAAFARAVDDELIARNPAHRAKIARTERREMVLLTPDEMRTLLARVTPHYRPLITTLFGTGLRLGEATALQVRDIHLEQSPPTLTVARAWKKGGMLGPPKTKKGRRTISLPDEVVTAIAPLLEGRAPTDLVFTNMAGRRVLQASLHDLWQGWIADDQWDQATRTRIPRVPALRKTPRLHDLRHGHASHMIGRGISVFDLQHRLGHESIQTTADVYGHLLPEAQITAARAASWTAPVPALTDRAATAQ